MLTLDAVRTAARSDTPWTALDDLVRGELAAGRTVAQLAAEFVPLANAVWETPGLSADGHDAVGDTLDALTGNCRAESCYRDPPVPAALPFVNLTPPAELPR